VLLSTLAGYFLHWQIDGWCGLVVSLLILWAGVQAARANSRAMAANIWMFVRFMMRVV